MTLRLLQRATCLQVGDVVRVSSAFGLGVFKYQGSSLFFTAFVSKCRLYSSKAKCNIPLEEFTPERIRNFSIVAHIDHGKSTLADRLLEETGVVEKSKENKQILDKLQVEKERGITVKAQTATMVYKHNGTDYLLNLIDTPGHVDFSYEVARSLQACQGVILLVDANQGVQAQTVANFYLAFSKNLVIIPVLNKIDIKHARPDLVCEQLNTLFDIEPETVLRISAKSGIGIKELLETVIEKIPAPESNRQSSPRSLLFDSWYDKYKGVASLLAVGDGTIHVGQQISLFHCPKTFEVKEVGIMHPDPTPCEKLYAGQVGYMYCNMRDVAEASMGDTVFDVTRKKVKPFEGFKKCKPMVYAGVYPMDQSEHTSLRQALDKLLLNDPSVESTIESSPALGQGWRLGFLGVLHMDVFNQRLEQEYGAHIVLTAPSVPFQVKLKATPKRESEMVIVKNPEKWPDPQAMMATFEPMVNGTIIAPAVFLGDVMSLCMDCRGVQTDSKNLDAERVLLSFKLPLNEIVVDFYDRLKSITSGYASFDYEDAGYEETYLSKLHFMLNGDHVEEMSCIVHASKAKDIARRVCEKLRDTIPRQQFLIAIQGAVGGKVLAREDIKPYRKDFATKLKFGGDLGRKQKQLKRQAEGKKKLRMVANIEIPRETFIKVLQR